MFICVYTLKPAKRLRFREVIAAVKEFAKETPEEEPDEGATSQQIVPTPSIPRSEPVETAELPTPHQIMTTQRRPPGILRSKPTEPTPAQTTQRVINETYERLAGTESNPRHQTFSSLDNAYGVHLFLEWVCHMNIIVMIFA